MEVRPSYKQTEVGVIPEDWDARTLLDLAERKKELFDDGDWVEAEFLTDRGIRLIQTGNIGEGEFTDKDVKKYISAESFKKLRCKHLQVGDILICRLAEPAGRACVLRDIGEDRMITAVDVTIFRPPAAIADRHFLVSIFTTARWYQTVAERCGGSTRTRISRGELGKISVPMPPLPEQRAIAAALSDMDALLGGLDRLIAKKRDLKQAAMQQLLTGQTRLPGFSGEWEVKRLKETAEISTGVNKPLSEMGSGALYVTVQDLYDGTSIRTNRLSRIKVSQSEIDAKGLAVGDIVFGKSSVKREGIGYPSQFLGREEPVVFSGFTYRARARHGIADAVFLFYALRTERTRRWLIDNSQASALTNINQQIADAIPVQVPPTVHEQSAIAVVLSDMDAELAALEARRNKTRALKQAMMQELLTGKTRLI